MIAQHYWSSSFQVNAGENDWTVGVPLPGVDPQHVALEAAGNTIHDSRRRAGRQPERPFRADDDVPQFLDLDKITASHRHGMLELTLPLKNSVKPRRIQISTSTDDEKQLTAAA